MSQHRHFQQQQQHDSFYNAPTGSGNQHNVFNFNTNVNEEDREEAKPTRKRRDETNDIYDTLHKATYIPRPGERNIVRTSGRKNRNEVLGLINAILTKEKHLNGNKYQRDVELLRGIQMNVNNDGFVLVLRTDGRIVAMSDDVEHHLGKTMRSLYTQCINIFECLDRNDGRELQTILGSSVNLAQQEHRLICTFRLPKGKRPSRTREDIKAINMVGHFFTCHDGSSQERLFIARCEALVSRTTNGSSSSQTAVMINNNNYLNSMIKLTLNEDMSIHTISSNANNILGYTRNEMIGNWFGRYLLSNDLAKFEAIRQRYFQHEQLQQQLPSSVCEIFDMFTSYGDGRLTFLCQIRPIRERRSKTIKFAIVAQLIDPSLRDEYVKYVQSESDTNTKLIKAEQVNLVSSSVSKTSEDTIVAASPSLAMGLLMFENINSNDFIHQQQYSPFHRSLSNVVAPVDINGESWQHLFDEFEFNQYSTGTDFQYWSTKPTDNTFLDCHSEQGLASIFNDYELDDY
jgi:hypothetical protein